MQAELFKSMAQAAADLPKLRSLLDSHRADHLDDVQFNYWDGVLASRSNDLARAVDILSACANAAPQQTAPRYELGYALAKMQRFQDSALAFESALNINPKMIPAWINLGFARLELNEFKPAEQAFRTALSMDENYAEAWNGLIELYEKFAAYEQASELAYKARARFGADQQRDSLLTRCLILAGQYDKAADFQRQLLRENPQDAMAEHLLGGLSGNSKPRANDGYIKQLFDGYADSYDQHMVAQMSYNVPQQVALQVRANPPSGTTALDLGCGTGLVAEALPEFSWTGVDLSANMIRLAANRGYQHLQIAEIESYLTQCPDQSVDLIVAANTLIYFGDLAPVLQHAHRILKPNGKFCFDVETDDVTQRFVQAPHGRYTHSVSYLTEQLQKVGLSTDGITPMHSRKDRAQPLEALLVYASKN